MALQFEAEERGDRIVRRKLSDQVLAKLRELIRKGAFKAGDTLPSERALMERFGVGRPAVREALQSLHNSGLITIAHGERSRVNAITADKVLDQGDEIARFLIDSVPSNLEHLKQARRMFELGIVRVATEKANADDVAALREIADRQRRLLGGDPVPFIKADMALHARIAEIVANPIVTAVSLAMLRWLFQYHTSLLHWSNNEEITLIEHDRIIDRIEAHDCNQAVALMCDHLDRATKLYAFSSETAEQPG